MDKDIGSGTLLRMWPTPMGKVVGDEGWFIDLVSQDRPTEELLNWVNTPARESNSRVLGPGYNLDTHGRGTPEKSPVIRAKCASGLPSTTMTNCLRRTRKLNFLKEARRTIEKTQRKYQLFTELINIVPTGRLNLRILWYMINPSTWFPLGIQFQAQFTAPNTFSFARYLKPSPGRAEWTGSISIQISPRQPPGAQDLSQLPIRRKLARRGSSSGFPSR